MSIHKKLLVVTCVSALAGLTACDNNRTPDTNREAAPTETSQNDQVKKEEVTGVQTDQIGKTESEEGTGEVKVQKEVTRSITSEERVPTVVTGERKLDINRMEADDFKAIGIPDSVAKNIVEWREQHNGFKSVDELSQVPGMNSNMLGSLRGKLGMSPAKQ